MRNTNNICGSSIGSEFSTLREQALDILGSSLEESVTQHPLDFPQVFEFNRPTLNGVVPLELYRTIRLMTFREILGAKVSAAFLGISGRSIARKLGVKGLSEVVKLFEDFAIGKVSIESSSDDLILFVEECATCSGLPNIGEPICHFEAGLIAGALESEFGRKIKVTEINCWGLGDGFCRWKVDANAYTRSKGNGQDNVLEDIINLASKASLAMENGIAVRQKNRELREAYQQLQESEKLKKDLTDMVVHDMRVPLTAIMGSLETLSDMVEIKLSDREAHLLELARSSSNMLVQMIDDLLDIGLLEERNFSLRKSKVELHEIIEQAVKQIHIHSRQKRQKISVSVEENLPAVCIDQTRMIRLIVNLLGNAIRHTPSEGSISISAEYDDHMKQIIVNVSDTGEGIPPEYHNKIFDKFTQIETNAKRQTSTGLGLTFCKLVAESHGGEIWVESQPGAGSKFLFTIPVS